MKSDEEIMQILEAFDLTRSYRDAGELAGCSPNTVAQWVARRDAGELTATTRGASPADRRVPPEARGVDGGQPWQGPRRCRPRQADGDGLCGLGADDPPGGGGGPQGVAGGQPAGCIARGCLSQGCGSSGDFGDGPTVAGAKAVLFCAWLSWSRFRVVLPIRDKSLPTVVACIDATLRRFGGCPTYALTDNEKTVTVEHVARVAIRNPDMVAAAGPLRAECGDMFACGCPVQGWVGGNGPGGQGRSGPYRRQPCGRLPGLGGAGVGVRGVLRGGERQGPSGDIAGPQRRCSPRNEAACTACRSIRGLRRSGRPAPLAARSQWSSSTGVCTRCPSCLAGEVVWVRRRGEEVIVTHVGPDGPIEVARHQVTTPGNPRVDDAHFPPGPEGPLHRTPGAGQRCRGTVLGHRRRRRAVVERSRGSRGNPGAGQDGRRRRPLQAVRT